jgi:hypothetical protein
MKRKIKCNSLGRAPGVDCEGRKTMNPMVSKQTMKKIILTAISWTLWTLGFGQDAQKFYEQGLEKAQAGQLEEAIKLGQK